MMDNEIKNIRLKFKCPADLDSMQTVDGGKFCNICQKKVYDFTDARQEVFRKILAENGGNICGRFRQDQVVPVAAKFPVWKRWVSAAMVLIGINVFNNKAEAQNIKIKPAKTNTVNAQELVNGMVEQNEPTFPGGFDVFTNFIHNNIRYTKGMKDGRVIASFVVNKDGSLSNIRILRGLSILNDNEVIRVLKLSPKWSPAIENNKPIAVAFNLPISFESSMK